VSFILDALRKSESERQRLGSAGIADLPLGRRRTQPWWVIGIAILLLANLALLAVVMLRPADPAPAGAQPQIAAIAPTAAAAPTAVARPQIASTLADDASPPLVEYETVDRATMEAASAAPDGPTLVRSTGASLPPDSLPPLRLDMHVYSQQRDARFVLINMRKYAEGQTLQEGPVVQHITETGVVLHYQNKTWELDRQ